MQVSVSAGGAGLVGVAEALAALLCMNRGLQVSGCSSDISCQQRRQRAEARAEETRREGWQRTAPRRAAPLTGDVWPIYRRRETFQPASGRRNGFD